jgi:hypothetical protein
MTSIRQGTKRKPCRSRDQPHAMSHPLVHLPHTRERDDYALHPIRRVISRHSAGDWLIRTTSLAHKVVKNGPYRSQFGKLNYLMKPKYIPEAPKTGMKPSKLDKLDPPTGKIPPRPGKRDCGPFPRPRSSRRDLAPALALLQANHKSSGSLNMRR